MSGQGTVLSIGSASVSVPSTAHLTGLLLANLQASLGTAHADTAPGSLHGTTTAPVTLPGPTGGGNNALFIPDSDDGLISVPGGYQAVLYQGQGTLTGGTSTQVIVGDLNYSGGAGTVVAGVTSGTVSSPAASSVMDTTAGAMLSFAGGSSSVTSGAAGQTIQLDGGANMVWLTDTSGGAAGTVFANGAGQPGGNWVSMVGGASGEFLGGGSVASSVFGGTGSDTVIAGSQVLYTGGGGNNLFVGGTGMSTVYGAANETIYSGAGGGVYSLAANSSDFVVAHGGAASSSMAADTVMLGSGTVMSVVWGNSNENMAIGAPTNATGALVVAYGTNDSIALANTTTSGVMNNEIVMWNANFGQSAFTGNTTLTGSDAGHDIFVMFGNLTQFGSTAEAAHTIVINNWQSSDLLNLSAGYSAADVQTAQQAIAAGNTQFTLADGTTVQLNGAAKPGVNQIYHQ